MLLYDYYKDSKERKNGKVIINSWESGELVQLCSNCPIDADLSFIDIKRIDKINGLFQWTIFNGTIGWDTCHIKSFKSMFMYSDYNQPLDWMFIRKGATITDMFKGARFSNKLPKTEQKLSFNNFVKRTSLRVTVELLKNNINVPIEKWCSYKNNRKLLVSNELYKDVLEWYIDQVDVAERIKLMEESGIEIFDI